MLDRSLERLLSETARNVEFPLTPDLSARVAVSLRERVPRRTGVMRPALSLALLATVLILVLALAITPSRDAIARLFGVEGSRVVFLPTPRPGEIATPFPTPVPAFTPDARDVSPVDVNELPALAGFAAALPAVDEARLDSSLLFYGHDPVVVHHYPSFDLWQSRLDGYASFGKLAPPWLRVREVDVGVWAGMWLSGGEHYVSYVDSSGRQIMASQRTVERSTLIWRTDAFFYRIETDLGLTDALRIAETLP
jgi:hypothetical protein